MSAYSAGMLVILRHAPTKPVRVMAIKEWSGARAGFMIEHDGPGVSIIDGWDVRPYRKEVA